MNSQTRILELFLDLLNEKHLSTTEIAEHYAISSRTAQRDLEVIRDLCEASELNYTLSNTDADKKYRLERHNEQLSLADAIAILKIVLGVRALHKNEILRLVEQLSTSLTKSDRVLFSKLSASERHSYRQVSHEQQLLEKIDLLLNLIENNLGFTAIYHHENKKMIDLSLVFLCP